MIKRVNIYPRTDVGILTECVCECTTSNYIVFNARNMPIINRKLSTEVDELFCMKCDGLLLSSGALKTAADSYKVSEGVLALFFRSYGVSEVNQEEYETQVLPIQALKKYKAPNPFWSKVKNIYRSSVAGVKKVPIFVVSALRTANKIGLDTDEDKY